MLTSAVTRLTALRLLRTAACCPMYELGLATGIDPSRLSRIERGLVAPSEAEVGRILEALGPEAMAALREAVETLIELGAGGR